MDTLYILDGYGLIFRSYFAFIRAPRRGPDGKNVSAVFGFFRTILSLFKEYGPSQFLIALDSKGPTFRDKIYDQYKATRDSTPEELRAQFPIIESAIAAYRLPALRCEGFEADDIIATLATRCAKAGRKCVIISSDKDLMQLVDGPVSMLRPSSNEGLIAMDREAIFADKGVWPEQIVDYLAIVGDSSDNVPGVKGLGEKGAAKLLAEFGSLDAIYEALDRDAVSPPGVAQKLRDGREMAYFSQRLVQLARDVEVPPEDFTLADLDGKALAGVLLPLGMKTLVSDIEKISGVKAGTYLEAWDEAGGAGVLGGTGDGATNGAAGGAGGEKLASTLPKEATEPEYDPGGAAIRTDNKVNDEGRLPDIPGGVDDAEVRELAKKLASVTAKYVLVDDAETLKKCFDEMKKSGIFALDTETTGVDPMTARIVGISCSAKVGTGYYIPILGPEGPVLDEDLVRNELRKLIESKPKIVGQNLKYDMKVLRRWGVEVEASFDTMVAAWVLESASNNFNMDDLAELYFGYRTTHYVDVIKNAGLGKDATFDKVDLEAATHYAAEDADITLRLYEMFDLLLKKRGLDKLFYGLEMAVLPVLCEMEFAGIGLDVEALNAYSTELQSRLKNIEQEIYELVGHEFNINSTKQLQQVLFEERKLQPIKKTQTGYSTDTSVLEELSSEDPVPRKILEFRGLTKLKSTYVDTLPLLVNPETGRIHTTFHQHGTATGRMSSKDPNLQNIPIKDEDGRKIRQAFVADKGKIFLSADYSQIELVVLAHFAGDKALAEAFANGVDVHRATGALIFGVEPDKVSPEQRRIAKTINFGVMYGMSAFRLARELGIPRNDAVGFIEGYFRSYQGIQNFIREQTVYAVEHGGVRTLLGRFRRIPEIYSSNKVERAGGERVAVNTPIQGTAADIVKSAMIRVTNQIRERGLKSRLLLQVHDELILECPEAEADEVEEILRTEMPKAVELSVPLSVSVERGKRWGEMH